MNNFLNSQYLHKHQSILNHNKKRLTQEQVKRLEASFDLTKKLELDQKLQLAKELGVPPRQIAIWYQNRRARWKNQSLELDYTTLQLKLDTTLAEKKQIEKENERLKIELKKVNEMLIAIKQAKVQEELAQGIIPCSISSGNCEEGGSSSFQEDVSCSWVNNNKINNNNNNNCESNLALDELYSCLMGGEEGSKYSLSWQNGKDLWVWKN
ncbi:homeobox-leucine zipper protein ATHB-52-like [Solanum stenotomum]|uniref:homeobox-leucine zipper protein ATHB-52-like n=1 Tax=Solanum stenotomum TaxID=172797 RepID=UPI0020D19534|nr:homeobox-leucine zipper protein ATHB-52-like [Solanum stenotomum]